MQIFRLGLLACAFTATASQFLLAQDVAVQPQINNWSYLNHSSTVAEGYLRGTAAAIQAAGQAEYMNSLAAVNYQEALRRRIENSRLHVKTYYENKETNREYRERYAKRPPTKEEWARITAAALPDRLTDEEFDVTTGKLVWPHILRSDEYKAFRDRIDELFAARTPENSGDGSPFQVEVADHIDTMLALLKSNISTVTRSQYGAAKAFLQSVDYEAFLHKNHPRPAPVADTKAAPVAIN